MWEIDIGSRVVYFNMDDPDMLGATGTIVDESMGRYALIKLDNGKMIYTHKKFLGYIEYRGEEMRKELTGYYAVAEVKIKGGYHLFVAIYDDGNTYKAGDRVLISTKGLSSDFGFEIVNILTPDEVKDKIYYEVIMKIDLSKYEERLKGRKCES